MPKKKWNLGRKKKAEKEKEERLNKSYKMKKTCQEVENGETRDLWGDQAENYSSA